MGTKTLYVKDYMLWLDAKEQANREYISLSAFVEKVLRQYLKKEEKRRVTNE